MEPLLAADSFLVRVRGGRAEVRGLKHHLDRFTRSVREVAAELGTPVTGLDVFIASALEAIAGYGDGFPRLELRKGGRLELRLRRPPELENAIALRSAAITGPENGERAVRPGAPAHQWRKGPNIERYAALNRELGAEALLIDARGHVLEGATTSLLWWHGDQLHVVEATARVASVSEALLCEIAERAGTIPHPRALSPADLARHETWAVNALHGIRPVTGIDDAPLPTPEPSRLARYREALDLTWEPVLG